MTGKVSALFRDRDAGKLDDESFHDALALAIPLDCSIKNETQLAHLPARVRTFYAAWQTSADVLGGGFGQAAFNNPHLFGDATQGFLELGLPEQAALIRRAKDLVDEGHANFDTPPGGDIGEPFEELAESAFAALDEESDALDFWPVKQRVEYALKHRAEFESVA